MGNSQTTPLSLLVDNFKDVRARGYDLSIELKKGKLITLCHSEWPTFGVGWPAEGTLCLPIILRVKSRVFLPGRSGHPDQIPYILVWQDLVENPPLWLAPFLLTSEPCKTLVAQPTGTTKRPKTPTAPLPPVLPDSQDLASLEPPPYPPPPGPHAQAQPAALPGSHEGQEAAAAPGETESEHGSGGPAGRTCRRVQREATP
ncbi:PREDICTED: uncharacterized protein LOC108539709 [Rhinopithecus bieti]|uniref:uncharacterized protein LOC108539709 n=1 Tax=Rhinopithecus bieti TaxID=61621 RepID=UPI00083C2051|nr:PREDICTED: uncharacterized protein LOC108539709 [Rhinopithecus bieti]